MQYDLISQRLKKLRQELKLSQTDFGRKIGKNYHSVMRWELGRVSPPANVLRHIAETFSININWLETGTGDIFTENADTGLSEPHHNKYESGLTECSEKLNKLIGSFKCYTAGSSSTPPVTKGDLLFYKPASAPDSEGLYLIKDQYNDIHARWFCRDSESWLSKRPDFPDLDLQQVICFGKIYTIIRQIDF